MRAVVLLAILGCALRAGAAEPETLRLWPEGAPGKMLPHSEATAAFIKKHQSRNTVTDIADPTITIYRPEKPNGTSVIVAPGGGYVFLSAVHEGTQVCEWLNTLGVTGILLKYRTPTRDEALPYEKPVADARQALKLVRKRAKEWKLNPERVGLMGFSAGGNLLAHAACDRGGEKAEVPNFGIMIYGGGFLDPRDPMKLAPDFQVPEDAPPMFIACAHDDKTNPVAATLLYLEYKKRNLPAELHLFTHGGHGFGMRDNKQPINQWPARCGEWMVGMGWLPEIAALDAQILKLTTSVVQIEAILREGIQVAECRVDRNNRIAQLKGLELDLAKAVTQGDSKKASSLRAELNRHQALHEQLELLGEEYLEIASATLTSQIESEVARMKAKLSQLQSERDQILSGRHSLR